VVMVGGYGSVVVVVIVVVVVGPWLGLALTFVLCCVRR
jgi:hypothetical protein